MWKFLLKNKNCSDMLEMFSFDTFSQNKMLLDSQIKIFKFCVLNKMRMFHLESVQ